MYCFPSFQQLIGHFSSKPKYVHQSFLEGNKSAALILSEMYIEREKKKEKTIRTRKKIGHKNVIHIQYVSRELCSLKLFYATNTWNDTLKQFQVAYICPLLFLPHLALTIHSVAINTTEIPLVYSLFTCLHSVPKQRRNTFFCGTHTKEYRTLWSCAKRLDDAHGIKRFNGLVFFLHEPAIERS